MAMWTMSPIGHRQMKTSEQAFQFDQAHPSKHKHLLYVQLSLASCFASTQLFCIFLVQETFHYDGLGVNTQGTNNKSTLLF